MLEQTANQAQAKPRTRKKANTPAQQTAQQNQAVIENQLDEIINEVVEEKPRSRHTGSQNAINLAPAPRRPINQVLEDHPASFYDRRTVTSSRRLTGDQLSEENGNVRVTTGNPPAYQQRNARTIQVKNRLQHQTTRPRGRSQTRPPMVLIAGVFLLSVVLAVILLNLAVAGYTRAYNHFSYGYPRTTQLFVDLQHGGQSHLIAVNNHGTIELCDIEPKPSNSKIFVLTRLDGSEADLIPVTLQTIVTSSGKTDVQVSANGIYTTLKNDGKSLSVEQ